MYQSKSNIVYLSDKLKEHLSEQDFKKLIEITDKTKDKHYIKKKDHLVSKYNNLTGNSNSENNTEKVNKIIKNCVINLTEQNLDKYKMKVLNLGPKFVPSYNKNRPYMDIIETTEICALDLEKEGNFQKAESLRQNISKIISKDVNKKHKNNLNLKERKAITEMKNDEHIKVYPFDKGSGFVIIEEKEAIKKIEEQIGKSKIIDYDPTTTLLNKFQKTLASLRKEGKFDNKTYYQIYPSDAIPPRLYGVIKAHKPEKNYPMRTIVSTIGTVPYGTSKYLVKIIQPTLNKNEHRVINSTSFTNEAKTWSTEENEIQVSYDVVNLYPSVPLDKAIEVLIDTLNEDKEDLKTRTKLTLTDIHKLAELCLSKCYFLFENKLRLLENSGPIGLSFMVILSESYLQKLESKAILEALNFNIAPKTFRRYVDDSHARFHSKDNANTFLHILNKQDPAIQYTIEYEDENKSLNFLDINIRNTVENKYEFKIHRKDAITNIQIKPHSCINPNIIKSVFKGFLHRAHSICSEKYVKQEEQFLVDMFVENGHSKSFLQKLVTEHNNNKNKNNTKQDYTNIKKLPWVPGIGPKIRYEFKKVGKNIAFTSSNNLQKILCKNKPKLLPNSYPGIYQLDCSCNGRYFGESKKKILTRCIEHQQDSMKGNWEKSGATEHTKDCHGQFNWIYPKTIKVSSNMYQRKVREALEINKWKTINEEDKSFTVLNRDDGDYVTTNSWKPLFKRLGYH